MRPVLACLLIAAPLAGWSALSLSAQSGMGPGAGYATALQSPAQAREALERSRAQARAARRRAEDFDRTAAGATAASDRAQAQSAALAARVQQAEAAIGAAEAQLALIAAERRALDLRLAQRREPIVQLAAALQTLVRRPLSLSLLTPHSLRETVYLGAVLDSTVPLVRERTAALRAELDRSAALQVEAGEALATRRANERRLEQRRTELSALATTQQRAARRAAGAADREELRALALGEQARDLDGLVDRLDDIGTLRAQLAALPGPRLRPADPGRARAPATTASAPDPAPTPAATAPPRGYRLPVDGRLATGFGGSEAQGDGLALVPRAGAQVVAPGGGRVVFAGAYRGYGRIVIVEHAGGWTSLVTGLDSLSTQVGRDVVPGSPLGRAAAVDPLVMLELRRGGDPVNPLDYLR